MSAPTDTYVIPGLEAGCKLLGTGVCLAEGQPHYFALVEHVDEVMYASHWLYHFREGASSRYDCSVYYREGRRVYIAKSAFCNSFGVRTDGGLDCDTVPPGAYWYPVVDREELGLSFSRLGLCATPQLTRPMSWEALDRFQASASDFVASQGPSVWLAELRKLLGDVRQPIEPSGGSIRRVPKWCLSQAANLLDGLADPVDGKYLRSEQEHGRVGEPLITLIDLLEQYLLVSWTDNSEVVRALAQD